MFLLKSLVLWVGFLAGASSTPLETALLADEQATYEQITLHIDGMTCSSCSIAIRKALRRLNGVHEVNVSFSEKRASVVFDSKLVTPERIIGAIENLGYGARIQEQR